MAQIKGMFDGVRQNVGHNTTIVMPTDWPGWFVELGGRIYTVVRPRMMTNTEQLAFADQLLQKHSAYGAEPLTRWGPLGIIIRLDSKFARFSNLCANRPKLGHGIGTDETIEDTITDMLGYCVLGYYATKGS